MLRRAVASFMKLACIGIALVLAGCGSQSDREREALRSAVSLLNEQAWLAEQAQAGRAPRIYQQAFRKQAAKQLDAAADKLGVLAPEAAGLIDAQRRSPPSATGMRAAARALRAIEDHLEAA